VISLYSLILDVAFKRFFPNPKSDHIRLSDACVARLVERQVDQAVGPGFEPRHKQLDQLMYPNCLCRGSNLEPTAWSTAALPTEKKTNMEMEKLTQLLVSKLYKIYWGAKTAQ